jgi:hypothetical protein
MKVASIFEISSVISIQYGATSKKQETKQRQKKDTWVQ